MRSFSLTKTKYLVCRGHILCSKQRLCRYLALCAYSFLSVVADKSKLNSIEFIFRHCTVPNPLNLCTSENHFPCYPPPTPPNTGLMRKSSPESPVVPTLPGRLRACWSEWQKLNPSAFVASVILHGYRIHWKNRQPPPRMEHSNTLAAQAQSPFVDDCIQDLLAKGVICPCLPSQAWCVLAVNVIPKPHSSKMRFILDGSPLKPYELTRKFKLEHLADEGRDLFPDCNYGGLIDLSDAYYHIELHPESRKYVAFCWRGQHYQFCCLPMGIHSAPFVFTRVIFRHCAVRNPLNLCTSEDHFPCSPLAINDKQLWHKSTTLHHQPSRPFFLAWKVQ